VEDKDGAMTISNLFDELKLTDFPDQVNQPTLDRLNEFLTGVGRPEVGAVTVRGLVDRMMKMNVPDGCQCWKVFDKQCKANVSHLSDEQRRTKRVLELQRVVVACSRGVFDTIKEAYREWGGAGEDTEQMQPTQPQVKPSVERVGGGYTPEFGVYMSNESLIGETIGGGNDVRGSTCGAARLHCCG
jgi:hypothetical protein